MNDISFNQLKVNDVFRAEGYDENLLQKISDTIDHNAMDTYTGDIITMSMQTRVVKITISNVRNAEQLTKYLYRMIRRESILHVRCEVCNVFVPHIDTLMNKYFCPVNNMFVCNECANTYEKYHHE